VTVLLTRAPMYGCVAPTLVRALARGLLRIQAAEVEDVCLLLGANRTECLAVWEGLVQTGGSCSEAESGGPPSAFANWRTPALGRHCREPRRDLLLAAMVNNARRMNKLPATQEDVFWVTRLVVFGSYLSEKQQLGDLDIAWSTVPRMGTEVWFAHCLASGKDPISKTRGMLCPRSPYVKLASFAEMLALACPYRLVYEFAPPVRRGTRAESGGRWFTAVRSDRYR
jgi:hypothetical protein